MIFLSELELGQLFCVSAAYVTYFKMNLDRGNPRQPNKLAPKRLPQEIQISSRESPPPIYNPYGNAAPAAYNNPNPYQPNPPQHQQSYGPPQGGPFHPNALYGQQPQEDSGYAIPGQYLANPVITNAAMQYGQHLMGTGKEYMDKEFEKYVPVTRLKYYFAVDTAYVMNKLRLLFFPFATQDWSVRYSTTEPVQPRFELNAPDLYIPTMAYLTYVLVAGLALGTQDRFTPESLGIQASSALAWTLLEILVYTICFFVLNVSTTLTTIDILAFSGYKFVGIIMAVMSSLAFMKMGYYSVLIYCSLSLSYFLMRTLKGKVLSVSSPAQTGDTRRLYLLLIMSCVQPFLMWFLSYHLVPSQKIELVGSVPN